MLKTFARCLLFSLALLPAAAWAAEPVKLKLSFFSSDSANLYVGGVKPFVDAVNSEAKGLLEIEVFFRGALGKAPDQQPKLVRDGVADIAFIVPGYTADQFPDNAVIELPGLFRDQREASLAYTRMIAANALRGYEDFIVITAFTVEPHSIHTRRPIASLDDLKGLKIRVNNPTEATTFEKLGMQTIIYAGQSDCRRTWERGDRRRGASTGNVDGVRPGTLGHLSLYDPCRRALTGACDEPFEVCKLAPTLPGHHPQTQR